VSALVVVARRPNSVEGEAASNAAFAVTSFEDCDAEIRSRLVVLSAMRFFRQMLPSAGCPRPTVAES